MRVRIDELPCPARAHCDSIRGWCLGIVRLGRPRTVSVAETSCRLRGDAFCELVAQWTR